MAKAPKTTKHAPGPPTGVTSTATDRPGEELTDERLVTLLKQYSEEAIGHDHDAHTIHQRNSLDLYFGLPYGDEKKGRSQVVSKDVSEVVDDTLPDLLEPFLATDVIGKYLPNREKGIENAKQATDYAHYVFWKDNDGFQILYNAAKDGLIQKNGITKVSWVVDNSVEDVESTGLNIAALQDLQQDSEVEINTTEIIQLDKPYQEYPDGNSYDVQYTRTNNSSRLLLESVPPEEFLITSRSKGVDNVPYCSHRRKVTKNDLLSMDFDKDLIETLPLFHSQEDFNSKRKRFRDEKNTSDNPARVQEGQRDVFLYEEYVHVDRNDGQGAQLLKVFRVDNTILEREPVFQDPFVSFTPYPMPHRFFGESQTDKVEQTQRIKTVLTRQMLDNVYQANNPRMEIPQAAMTVDTVDDYLNFGIGSIIRTAQPGLIRPIETPDRSGVALQAIQYYDLVRVKETGVQPGSGALSADAIDRTLPTSAQESRRVEKQGQKRVKMMARIFADGYLRQLFTKMLKIMTVYQDFERTIEIRGKWVPVDPSYWDANMKFDIRVGLGHPNSKEMLEGAFAVLNLQKEAREIGLVSDEHFYNTAEKVVEASGFRFPGHYFFDPADPGAQQEKQKLEQEKQQKQQAAQQQDPRFLKAQADVKIAQQKFQLDSQMKKLEIQRDTQLALAKIKAETDTTRVKNAEDADVDRMKITLDHQVDQEKIQREFMVASEKLISEVTLAEQKLAAEVDLAERKLEEEVILANKKIKAQANGAAGSANIAGGSVRFGGNVG